MDFTSFIEDLKGITELIEAGNGNKLDVDSKLARILSHVPSILSATSPTDEKCVNVQIDLFRFLRNFVANSEKRQHSVAGHESFECIISWIGQVSAEAKKERTELRCAVQFLGNLIANNDVNKMAVWRRIFPYFDIWLQSQDDRLENYAAMVLYNCILNVPNHREDLVAADCADRIVVSLLDRAARGNEWGLFVIECCLESEKFMEKCYLRLGLAHRLNVLDILCSKLSRDTTPSVPVCALEFVAEEFELKADVMLSTVATVPENTLEVLQIVKYLDVLCSTSTLSPYQIRLQEFSSLPCTLIYLLKSIHLAGKQTPNYFSTGERLDSEAPERPASGFKKNLIRLIANLCWRCTTNQNKIRELDGIPLLLDCCKIDAENPFILQWVIFAIRNLCENNPENQHLIGQMEQKDCPGGAMSTVPGSSVDEDRAERAKDDIRDLML